MEVIEAIDKAKRVTQTMEAYEDLDIMSKLKGGESRRAADYIRNDMPLMIAAARNEDPALMPDLNDLQKATLSLSARDLKEHIEGNRSAAARTLGWHAPFLKPEMRDFMNARDGMHEALSSPLVEHQSTLERNPPRSFDIINDEKLPVPEEAIEQIRRNAKYDQEFHPGLSVVTERDERGRAMPGAESSVIAEMKVQRLSEESAAYIPSWRLEGEEKFRTSSEIADARGHEHEYGVMMQKAGATFIVPLKGDGVEDGPEPIARRVIGVDMMMTRQINHDVAKDREERGIQDEPLHVSGLREAVGGDEFEGVGVKLKAAGEFRYRNVDGPGDERGPVILESVPWMSSASDEELSIASKSIDKHLQKFEYNNRSLGEEASDLKKEKAYTGPKTETTRNPQSKAVQQQYLQQQNGMGM